MVSLFLKSERIEGMVPASPVRPAQARLRHVIDQEPLFETRPSRRAIDGAAASLGPRTVFAGIGLVSGPSVTRALPFDVLGLLLSAEHARRALSAERLLVMVADTHARENGAPHALLEQKAHEYASLLRAIAACCGLHHMEVLRASAWEHDAGYQSTLRRVQRALPASTHGYVVRETADIAHVERVHGPVLKVGWALRGTRGGALRDERMFDEAFRRFVGGDSCFVYAKAGRALDDRRQKVSPYIASNPARRICLEAGEDVVAKLHEARGAISHSTYRGVCNHLRAVTRSYSKLVRPLRGDVAQRAQAVIAEITAQHRAGQREQPAASGGAQERAAASSRGEPSP